MPTHQPIDPQAPPTGFHQFCPVTDINFQFNRWAELIGPHAVPEIGAVAGQVSTHEQAIDVFLRLSDEAVRELDAAYYLRGAEFFMPPTDERKSELRSRFVTTMRRSFNLAPELVPYESSYLPAYDLRPAGQPTSTWVVFGGFDSYSEEWFPLLNAVAAQGRRVVMFDGPGQGGALEDYGLPMTPAWHRPVGAVLDHFGLDDVTLIGISMGGALVMHAAAAETRVSRAVAWNAMDDFLEVLTSVAAPIPGLSKVVSRLPRFAVDKVLNHRAAKSPVVAWGLWQGMHILGVNGPADMMRAAASYRTAKVSRLVTADVLVLQGAEDHYVPNHQAWRQARTLTQARSVTVRTFTAADDAANHCQVGNIPLALRTILAWEEQLRARDETFA